MSLSTYQRLTGTFISGVGLEFPPLFGDLMEILKEHRSFGGTVRFCQHNSKQTRTKMRFSTYVPDGHVNGCLIWLSGLGCTDENFMMKAGAQAHLAQTGLMVICPDTSPRGLALPREHETDHFGCGASFYLDATTPDYRDHYRMYSYVTEEIYGLAQKEFKVGQRISIFGHSMGGHGALVMGLREKEKFVSVSAFAPVAHPTQSPRARDAFLGYLGEESPAWKEFDATELIRAGRFRADEILVDQGADDPLLKDRLLLQDLIAAAGGSRQKLDIRLREGYDHSYYYIATFIEAHIHFHAARLKQI